MAVRSSLFCIFKRSREKGYNMNSLNIDLRDGCLRILVMKDKSVKYSKTISDFLITDGESAARVLASEIKEAGGKKGRVNVILPSDVVKHRVYQIPSMDLADARKVISRELSREMKGPGVVFGIRRIFKEGRTGGGRQHILAEYADKADAVHYFQLLRKAGIKPDTITSSLEGNAAMFNRFRPDTEGNEAVVDIGSNIMEVAVFNSGHLMGYEKLAMSKGFDEKPGMKDQPSEQSDKMKVYTIVDALYKFILGYGEDLPEKKISSFWICGINSVIDGIDASVSDGVGMSAKIITPFDLTGEKGSALSALCGISELDESERLVNFIPEDILDSKTRFARNSILAASLSFYVILLAGSYAVLNQTEKDLRIQLNNMEQSVKSASSGKTQSDDIYISGQQTLARLVSESHPFYPVFRDLATLVPAGVVLESLQIEKAQGLHNLRIGATIPYSDENFKKALLSSFLGSLETSSRLRMKAPPEISTPKPAGKERAISVTALYEVVE